MPTAQPGEEHSLSGLCASRPGSGHVGWDNLMFNIQGSTLQSELMH